MNTSHQYGLSLALAIVHTKINSLISTAVRQLNKVSLSIFHQRVPLYVTMKVTTTGNVSDESQTTEKPEEKPNSKAYTQSETSNHLIFFCSITHLYVTLFSSVAVL